MHHTRGPKAAFRESEKYAYKAQTVNDPLGSLKHKRFCSQFDTLHSPAIKESLPNDLLIVTAILLVALNIY